jgi:tetratricopeptide (TPR) repeat protein
MSALLEILGRGITINTADLIAHWLNEVKALKEEGKSQQDQQLNKVIELLCDRKLDTAQERIKQYLFQYPSCTRGRMAAASLRLYKNQIKKAIDELNSVYLRQPNNTMALYALGHCYERLGKESEAIEFYQDCLKFKSYLQLPAQRLAAIYFKNSQFEKTIQQYELLKNEYPDDIPTLVTLGHLYIAGEEYTKAVETFNTAILIHPGNFYTDDDEIEQLITEGQLYQTLEYIDDLLRQQADRPDLITKKADILSMLGANADAVSQYEEAINMCPNFLEPIIKLGTQYLQLNDTNSAARQFNRAVEINDQIVDAYIGLSTAYKLAGALSEALSTLSLAAAIQPNSSFLFAETATLQFMERFGRSFNSLDGHDSANLIETVICAHKKEIVSRPQNPDLYYRLGILMMSVARLEEAIEAFHNALDINPTYHRARSKLAVCLIETNHSELALKQLMAPDYLDKDSLKLHYKVAMLYCDRLKFASSLMNLDRLLENNFTNMDAAVNISIVLQNLGILDRVTITWDNLSDTARQAIGPDEPPLFGLNS